MEATPVAFFVTSFSFERSTFLRRELERLPDAGVRPILFYLRRPAPEDVRGPEFDRFRGEIMTASFVGPGVVVAQVRALLTRPGRYLSTLLALVARSWRRPAILIQSLALFPQAVFHGQRARRLGCRRAHGLWATASATSALIAARTADLRFSFTGHAWDVFLETTLLGWKVRQADHVLTCTDHNRRSLVDRYAADRPDKVVLNYHGLPLEEFAYAVPDGDSRTGAATLDRPPLILAIGNKVEKKGFHVLIEACGLLAGRGTAFRCEIVGPDKDPEYAARLRRRIGELGLSDRVTLVDYVSSRAMPAKMAEATVVAQPSVINPQASRDGIPNVLIEAMAVGRPVVSTTISGIPELVNSEVCGLLVPPGEPAALADAIARVLCDPTAARRFAEAGRRKVEADFDLTTTVRHLAATLRAA